MSDERITEKVAKLLRLAKSSNPHEAALAAARAQEMIDRYNLSEIALEEAEQRPEEAKAWDEPLFAARSLTSWQKRLAVVLSQHNQCKVVTCSLSRTERAIKIVGTATDVLLVREMFRWCAQEVESLAYQHRGNGGVWLNNYRIGVTDGIADQLEKQKAATREQLKAESSTALVCIQRSLAVQLQKAAATEAAVAKAFPRLRKEYSSVRPNYSARQQGRAAGQRMNLTGTARRRLGS